MNEPVEKVYLACDVSNIWKACRNKHGADARVNFEVLKDVIPSITEGAITQKLVAYTLAHPRSVHKTFEEVLDVLGYDIVSRDLVYVDDLKYPLNTNWSCGISFDVLDVLGEYDTFVFVTGNGEFEDLINKVKSAGKKTIVMTFESPGAQVLYRAADELLYLADEIVYKQSATTKA